MSWMAAAVIGGAVIGGIGSNMAAGKQADAANNATAAQQAMFAQTQQNLKPYMDAGTGSLGTLMTGVNNGSLMPKSYTPYDMTTFQSSPEYQLMMQQNKNAMDASGNRSSMTGGANSNNMKSLMDWTQGNTLSGYSTGLNNYMTQFLTGNQATNQQFNTLSSIAGLGENAAAGLGNNSAQVGSQIGSNITNAGNAQAAGTVGVSNALTSGIGQGYNQWLQQKYLNQGPSAQSVADFAQYG